MVNWCVHPGAVGNIEMKKIFFILILLFAGVSHAATETIAATAVTRTAHKMFKEPSDPTKFWDTLASACNSYGARAYSSMSGFYPISEAVIGGNSQCGASNGSPYQGWQFGIYTESSCAVNGTVGPSCVVYSCPANQGWTLSGSTCSRDATVGQQLIVDALNLAGAPLVGAGGGLATCYAGVPVLASGSATGGGVTNYMGPFKLGTGSCSTVAQATSPVGAAACKSNQYFGQVNGVDQCINGATVSTSTTSVAPAAGASGVAPALEPGAPSGTVSKTTTGSCLLDGTCTFVDEYKNSAGAVIGTKTETTKPDPTKDQCVLNPESVGCQKLGAVLSDQVPKATRNVNFSAEDLGFGSGSCPQPFGWSDKLGQHQIDLTSYCGAISTYVRPVVIAIALLMAFFIVAPIKSGA